MERDDFLAEERERTTGRVTVTLASANLLRWLAPLSAIPEEISEEFSTYAVPIRSVLRKLHGSMA